MSKQPDREDFLLKRLDCSNTCVFGKRCGIQYLNRDSGCVEKIDESIASTPGSLMKIKADREPWGDPQGKLHPHYGRVFYLKRNPAGGGYVGAGQIFYDKSYTF